MTAARASPSGCPPYGALRTICSASWNVTSLCVSVLVGPAGDRAEQTSYGSLPSASSLALPAIAQNKPRTGLSRTGLSAEQTLYGSLPLPRRTNLVRVSPARDGAARIPAAPLARRRGARVAYRGHRRVRRALSVLRGREAHRLNHEAPMKCIAGGVVVCGRPPSIDPRARLRDDVGRGTRNQGLPEVAPSRLQVVHPVPVTTGSRRLSERAARGWSAAPRRASRGAGPRTHRAPSATPAAARS